MAEVRFNHFNRVRLIFHKNKFGLELVCNTNEIKVKPVVRVKYNIREKFNEIGYEVALKVINAKEYGVPQSRERVVFLAVRKDLPGDNSWLSSNERISARDIEKSAVVSLLS